uniref:Uncharacterized protein n=1 Tax=Arundo donax TaxID=35708 RepID=A0A0A9AJL1_ARUDO
MLCPFWMIARLGHGSLICCSSSPAMGSIWKCLIINLEKRGTFVLPLLV